jgi:hypothetical protein
MAIARVLSRRAKLEGESEADFAMSEMLMEQFCDVITTVGSATQSEDKYALCFSSILRPFFPAVCLFVPHTHCPLPCRAAAWKTVPARLTNLFAPVSKLLGDKASFTSSLTAGELAVAVAISFASDVDPSIVAAFPNLVSLYEKHRPLIEKTLRGYAVYYAPK